MALNWNAWGRDFMFSVMRHVGTAGMTWTGMSFQDGKLDVSDLHSLWIAVLSGAILPTLFTALQSPPTEETTVVVEQTTKTTTATTPVAPPAGTTTPPNPTTNI